MSTSKDAEKIVYGTDTEKDILNENLVQDDSIKQQSKRFSPTCKVLTVLAAALALAGAGTAIFLTYETPAAKLYTVKKYSNQTQSNGLNQLWTSGEKVSDCSQNFYSSKTNAPVPMPHQLILC